MVCRRRSRRPPVRRDDAGRQGLASLGFRMTPLRTDTGPSRRGPGTGKFDPKRSLVSIDSNAGPCPRPCKKTIAVNHRAIYCRCAACGFKNTSLEDPRSNNIAHFRQVNPFSHGLDGSIVGPGAVRIRRSSRLKNHRGQVKAMVVCGIPESQIAEAPRNFRSNAAEVFSHRTRHQPDQFEGGCWEVHPKHDPKRCCDSAT